MRCVHFVFFVKNFDRLKQSNFDGVRSCNLVVASGITSRRCPFNFFLFFLFLFVFVSFFVLFRYYEEADIFPQ